MAYPFDRGDEIKRTELHEQFGGRRQGGISPSKQSPHVFVFTDQAKGALHGYVFDGWHSDGLFHYTGEGQKGDQAMVQGNRAIRDHQIEGRSLFVFDAHAGMAKSLGEFEYVDDYPADARETKGGPFRSVIVFRLRPLNAKPGAPTSRLGDPGDPGVKEVPVEQHLTERMLIDPDREPYEAERREQPLVRELMASWTAEGHEVCRLQIQPPAEVAPLLCDLYDKTTKTLVEAKGTVARNSFRMAIGQLADYGRFVDSDTKKAILVPSPPRSDLLALAKSQGIEVLWPTVNGSGFESSSAA